MTASPQAFRAALACLVPPSEQGQLRLAAAVQGIDWDRFAAVVHRHRVAGLATEALARAGLPVPARTQQEAQAGAHRTLFLTAETSRVDAVLAKAGIVGLVFKGAPLAQEAYGDVGVRHARDIDLLIGKDQVQACWRILEELGYERISPPKTLKGAALQRFFQVQKDSVLRDRRRKIEIELHWRLADAMPSSTPIAFQEMRRLQLSGGPYVRTLGQEFNFVYLCVHGSHHGWMRLKWLADIAMLLHKAEDGGEAYWHKAVELGCGPSVELGMRLSAELLGTRLPAAFQALPPSWRIRLMLAKAKEAMLLGEGEVELHEHPGGLRRLLLFQTLMHRDARAWLSELRRLSLSPEDLVLLPLPGPLHFLYLPLRPVLWGWRKATGYQAPH